MAWQLSSIEALLSLWDQMSEMSLRNTENRSAFYFKSRLLNRCLQKLWRASVLDTDRLNYDDMRGYPRHICKPGDQKLRSPMAHDTLYSLEHIIASKDIDQVYRDYPMVAMQSQLSEGQFTHLKYLQHTKNPQGAIRPATVFELFQQKQSTLLLQTMSMNALFQSSRHTRSSAHT